MSESLTLLISIQEKHMKPCASKVPTRDPKHSREAIQDPGVLRWIRGNQD